MNVSNFPAPHGVNVLLLFAAALLLRGCGTVPVTGRKQVVLVSSSQMASLGADTYSQKMAASRLSGNAGQTAMVKRVGARVSQAVEQYLREQGQSSAVRGFVWEFNLIEDPVVNAWCIPGGKVGINTGILPVCQNEAGLAVVMGHEIAHAVANHGGERMSQQLLAQMGGMGLAAALQQQPEQTQQLAMAVFGAGTQLGALYPYSRLHEFEADRLGMVFMAMAGYDPNEAPQFWERMQALKSGGAQPQFLSTHPSDANRIRELREAIPEAMRHYKP